MSQHAFETCNESNGLWLPLIEYSVKSGLSLSTIRRKIKSNTLSYRLERGRYLVLFSGMGAETPRPAPVLVKPVAPPMKAEHADENAVRMVSEAFEHALREKEERLALLEKANKELEERLNELKLLVRVLEEKYEVRY